MAVYISGKEVTDRISRIIDRIRALKDDRSAIERYATDLQQEGVNASTIQTDVNAKLVDWGSVRDEIVGDLNDLPLFWKSQVKIGMGALYNAATVEANNPSNVLTDLSTGGLVVANESAQLKYGPGPFNVFLASDVVEISKAADRDNNMRAQVRYTPDLAGVDLITNGGFADATGWTESGDGGTEVVITGGKAVFTAATATLSQTKANMISAGAAGDPSIGWVLGQRYLATFTIDSAAAGTLSVGTNTTAAQHTITANGTHKAIILSDGNAAGLIFTATGFTGNMDNVKLIPLSGLVFNEALGGDTDSDTTIVITLQER